VAVVKVTQHLCQKQLQSSSLSCSFIITHTHAHSHTHTHTYTYTQTVVSAGKSFHFFSFYLTGIPEKLVEQIFMKILLLLLQFHLLSLLFYLPLALFLSFAVALRKQSQKSRSTLFLVCCLLPASPIPHWLPFSSSPNGYCHYPVTMTANWLLFVSF